MEIPLVGMIISAVSAVLLPLFSKNSRGGFSTSILPTWKSTLEKSAKIVFPMLLFSIVFARDIMVCLYGDTYEQSAVYFQIKNFSGLFYIIPFAPVILAINKTREYSQVHFLIAVLMIAFEYLSVLLVHSPIAIAIVSESLFILKTILLTLIISKFARIRLIDLLPVRVLFKLLLIIGLAVVGAYYLSSLLSLSNWLLLAVELLLFVGLYYSLCWLFSVSYKDIVISLISNRFVSRLVKYIP